jgi:hypothetical protein
MDREQFANTSEFMPEDSYFERVRNLKARGFKVKEIERKWSGGNSPIILIRFKYWS